MRLYFGLRRRHALKVVYTMVNGKDNTLFMSFDGRETISRIAQDLYLRKGLKGGGLEYKPAETILRL